MSGFDNLFASAEQKYGLPPGILAATAKVESSLNPRAVSEAGAQGLMQLLPSTARNLGANPLDPPSAVDAAGRLWAQNLKATGGDIDRAAMMYHGGTDTRQWGPKTHAYPQKLAAALGPQQPQPGGGDPIEAALSGHPTAQQSAQVQADPNDPIESALAGGNSGSNGARSTGPGVGPVGAQGDNADVRQPGDASGRNMGGSVPGAQSGQEGAQAPGLQPHQVGYVPGAIDAFGTGLTAGIIHPLTAGLNAVLPLDKLTGRDVHSVWDGSSLSDAFHHNLGVERGEHAQFQQDHGVTSTGADIAGAIVSPFNKLFAPAEGAGFLRSIPNFMAQGATYGGVRGLADTGKPSEALTDAGIGAGLGPVGAALGNVGGKVVGAALRARSTLSTVIPQTERAAASDMIDAGASADQVVSAHPNLDPSLVDRWVQYRARGGKAPVSFKDTPPQTGTTPQQYAAALGTQGSRRGVESVTDLPPQVQADVQRLRAVGVSPEEAQAEADIRYVGGNPTVANVTRDPSEQRAMFEGAKQGTPEGAQLAETIAANNQALHSTVIGTVDNLGGVPAQGEAAETAAQALAKASDSAKAGVDAKYKAARATDGEVKINTDELRELLQSPELSTPTNPQVKQLAEGVLTHLKASDTQAGTTLRSPEQIEQIRQLANSAYDPMGGPVNSAVGRIGGALNDSLDQLDTASAAWKAARAAHRDWASQYSDPAGVAKLIARDAKGNFLNADAWRLSENGLIDRLNDQPFAHVVTQLKKIGSTDALDKLKAGIIQRAYERSTNSARDQLGNPTVNGKLFQNELNKIGLPKLKALFSPQELAHLATVGRAARAMNEAVPGVVNTSNTSSSLVKALGVKPGEHPYMKGFKYVAALSGHIPAAVAVHGAEHLSTSAAQRAIGQGVREQLNPALARTAATRSTTRIENAQFRTAMGRALRKRGAVPAADNDRGKAIGRRLSGAF